MQKSSVVLCQELSDEEGLPANSNVADLQFPVLHDSDPTREAIQDCLVGNGEPDYPAPPFRGAALPVNTHAAELG